MRRHLHREQVGPGHIQYRQRTTDPNPEFLAVGTLEMERISEAELDADERAAARDVARDLPNDEIVEIVHDLKNPLATIALEMCLLQEKLGDHAEADIQGVVARVTRNVLFLDRMVQDILDSRSIENGELQLHRRPTELRTLLEDCVERSIATRDRRRIFIDAAVRVTISIDDLRIERVVANLLQNALKYSTAASGIVLRLELSEHAARISVVDSGPGMTADEVKYVFDKYRRTDGARAFEGSGLGLYVSKRIVAAHGGWIGVESVLDIGTRFMFELPLD